VVCDPDGERAKDTPVAAVDVVLEPDETMTVRARDVNARLLAVYPDGFALDADHQPHITMLQRFVRAADLDDLCLAANTVFADEDPTDWTLTASKAYYIPSPPIGLAGIVVEPTDDLVRLQQKLIDAIAPYTVPTATIDAFASAQEGRDIQASLVQYVATFVPSASGENFNPHVTTGAAPQSYLDDMMAEPFEAFSFSPTGASVYQLGTFGTAQKKLATLTPKP
jgi:2'-5' RNA ligase superfamily